MALMNTPVCDFGWKAKNFSLKGVDGKTYTLDDVKGEKGTLVMFICNHCPYVKAIVDRLAADAKTLQDNGIGVIAVMPNNTETHPADSFDNMKIFAEENGFTFPYVIDETQVTARAYDAICTPDFFGFNADLELQYRGRLDEGTPSNEPGPDVERELLNAMLAVAKTGRGPDDQIPSMGCSIKWKEDAAA